MRGRASSWPFIKRRKFLTAVVPVIIFTSIVLTYSSIRSITFGEYRSNDECLKDKTVVASITTTLGRIRDGKFLAAIRSVIAQNYPSTCLDVWAFIPTEKGGIEGSSNAIEEIAALLRPVAMKHLRRVFLFTLVNDPGPVSKFIFTIEALTWHSRNEGRWRPLSSLTHAVNFGTGNEHPSDKDLANYMSSMQGKAPLIFVCDDDR
jgi:hypothetical protein